MCVWRILSDLDSILVKTAIPETERAKQICSQVNQFGFISMKSYIFFATDCWLAEKLLNLFKCDVSKLFSST